MRRQFAIGTLSIIASLPVIWIASGLTLGFGASPASWMVLRYAVPGATALAAGILLIVGVRASYTIGFIGWVLLVLVAASDLWLSYQSYAPGAVLPVEILVTEVLYVAVGVVVLIVLVRHRRTTVTHSGGGLAA